MTIGTHFYGDGCPEHPMHLSPCVRALDGDGEPLGYCVACYQDLGAEPATPMPEQQGGASVPITVESFGEDGEWLVAFGHHDLDAFRVVAEAEAERLYCAPQELATEPRHRWMRPVLRADCDNDEEFAWQQADDWHLWTDDPTEPGAEPITIAGLDT